MEPPAEFVSPPREVLGQGVAFHNRRPAQANSPGLVVVASRLNIDKIAADKRADKAPWSKIAKRNTGMANASAMAGVREDKTLSAADKVVAYAIGVLHARRQPTTVEQIAKMARITPRSVLRHQAALRQAGWLEGKCRQKTLVPAKGLTPPPFDLEKLELILGMLELPEFQPFSHKRSVRYVAMALFLTGGWVRREFFDHLLSCAGVLRRSLTDALQILQKVGWLSRNRDGTHTFRIPADVKLPVVARATKRVAPAMSAETEELVSEYNQRRKQDGAMPLTSITPKQQHRVGDFCKWLDEQGLAFGDFLDWAVKFTARFVKKKQMPFLPLDILMGSWMRGEYLDGLFYDLQRGRAFSNSPLHAGKSYQNHDRTRAVLLKAGFRDVDKWQQHEMKHLVDLYEAMQVDPEHFPPPAEWAQAINQGRRGVPPEELQKKLLYLWKIQWVT